MNLHRVAESEEARAAVEIRVRGRVQGVGFRPTVWRLAREHGLSGEVLNDCDGVLVRVGGSTKEIADFIARMWREPPPLGRIDRIETQAFSGSLPVEFMIAESEGGAAHTQVTPDAAICEACGREVQDPFERRYRYPFTNCTHCGPRFSIVAGIPYDRAQTTMAVFPMCEACAEEYRLVHDLGVTGHDGDTRGARGFRHRARDLSAPRRIGRTSDRHAAKGRRVRRVTLEVGVLSGILPEAIAFCSTWSRPALRSKGQRSIFGKLRAAGAAPHAVPNSPPPPSIPPALAARARLSASRARSF